jgi:concanavalin A-like lectin/glucanase superfamily protein
MGRRRGGAGSLIVLAIDMLRMRKTGVLTDPNYASSVLILNMIGANGSTTFTDQSFKARGNATVFGNAQISTSVKKYGTGSLRLDGVGDMLTYADSADWEFGSAPFGVGIRAAIDASNIEAENVLIGQYDSRAANPNARAWLLVYSGSLATNQLRFVTSSTVQGGATTTDMLAFNFTPTADQMYDFFVDRDASHFRLYIDGAMVAKTASAITIFAPPTLLYIGARPTTGGTNQLDNLKGNIDALAIWKGVAPYASDSGYTVPTDDFATA